MSGIWCLHKGAHRFLIDEFRVCWEMSPSFTAICVSHYVHQWAEATLVPKFDHWEPNPNTARCQYEIWCMMVITPARGGFLGKTTFPCCEFFGKPFWPCPDVSHNLWTSLDRRLRKKNCRAAMKPLLIKIHAITNPMFYPPLGRSPVLELLSKALFLDKLGNHRSFASLWLDFWEFVSWMKAM